MRKYQAVQFLTPNGVSLFGLWSKTSETRLVFIFVHGLGGSVFSSGFSAFAEAIGKDASLFIFNNRGHDIVSKYKIGIGEEEKINLGGAGLENFADCADDIAGAVSFVLSQGTTEVVLVGHSTGCQKAIFYLSRIENPKVSKVILLAPISDLACVSTVAPSEIFKKAFSTAKQQSREGKGGSLLSESVWPQIMSADRFLSLYTKESDEEIFCYGFPDKKPDVFRSVKIPILAVFAGADEHSPTPAEKIARWFSDNFSNKASKSVIIPEAKHNFKGYESVLGKEIQQWLSRFKK